MGKPNTNEFTHCRECGCTNNRPCTSKLGPCFWIEEDLCSACALEAKNPNPAHAEVFEAVISQSIPQLLTPLQMVSVMSLLVAKGLVTQDELSKSFLNVIREQCEPIQHPGAIILPPGRNLR